MLSEIQTTDPDLLKAAARQLEKFVHQYPSEEDAIKLLFLALTNNPLRTVQFGETIEWGNFYTAISDVVNNDNLSHIFKAERALHNFLDILFSEPEDMDIAASFAQWNNEITNRSRNEGRDFTYGSYAIRISNEGEGWN